MKNLEILQFGRCKTTKIYYLLSCFRLWPYFAQVSQVVHSSEIVQMQQQVLVLKDLGFRIFLGGLQKIKEDIKGGWGCLWTLISPQIIGEQMYRMTTCYLQETLGSKTSEFHRCYLCHNNACGALLPSGAGVLCSFPRHWLFPVHLWISPGPSRSLRCSWHLLSGQVGQDEIGIVPLYETCITGGPIALQANHMPLSRGWDMPSPHLGSSGAWSCSSKIASNVSSKVPQPSAFFGWWDLVWCVWRVDRPMSATWRGDDRN